MALLFPPLFVDDVLRVDVVFAPFIATPVAVEENGLEDMG